MSENKKRLIIIFVITILGCVLRFSQLDKIPASLNWDEVSHGYNAYSILKTGKDEWGKFIPFIFRAFGDYKLPVYIYLTVIPVFIFGLNAFAVRFVSALAGTLAIPGVYLLSRELFPNTKTSKTYFDPGTISALLLAISPWHFFISRPALEANLALTLIIFGSYYLVRFFNHKSSFLPASILLGLSMHTYNTSRVFVPTLIFATLLIFRSSFFKTFIQGKFKTINILSVIILGVLSLLVVTQVLSGEGAARYEKLKILSPAVIYQIGETRSKSSLPPILSKIVFNRPVAFVSTAAKNYLGYFSPQFFYQTWGAQFQFAIPGQNLLTLPVYLLSVLGVFVVVSSIKNNKSYQLLLSWLLLSPVAASLTADPPQALRPNPMIPALLIFASCGFLFVLEKVTKKYQNLFFVGVFTWIFVSFLMYFNGYTNEYKSKYSSSWQYGYAQVMNYVHEHASEYDNVFITKRYGEPHIFYSFYTKLDPQKLQPGSDNIRFEKTDWFWTDKIGHVYFINDWQIPKISISTLPLESGGEISTVRSLLVTSPDHIPVNAHIIDTVNFLDGSPAFIITSVP